MIHSNSKEDDLSANAITKNTTVAVFRKSESRKVSVELGRRPLYVVNVALYSIFNAALARMLSHHRPVHQHTTQCFCYTHTRCQCQRDDLYSTLTISPPNAPSASGVANLEWVRLGSPPLHALHTLLLCQQPCSVVNFRICLQTVCIEFYTSLQIFMHTICRLPAF